MAVTGIYNSYRLKQLDGTIDLSSDTIRVALLSTNTAYSPTIDSEEFVDDVLDSGTTAEELSATNYTRKTISNKQFSQDNTDDEGVLDIDNITWNSLGNGNNDTIQGILVYRQVGGDDSTPADDDLLFYDESSGDLPKDTNGSNIELQIPSEGFINLQ